MTDELIDALERAEGASRELDRAIELLVLPERVAPDPTVPLLAYTASIDAALTLVPEGWIVLMSVYQDGAEALVHDDRVNPVRLPSQEADAATPALALAAAALRARRESAVAKWEQTQ